MAGAPDPLPFGVVHRFPGELRYAFVRLAMHIAGERGTVPRLDQIAVGLAEPRKPWWPRTAEAMFKEHLGDNDERWTTPEGWFDPVACHAHYERVRADYEAALAHHRRYKPLADAAQAVLASITPPVRDNDDGGPVGITSRGIALIEGDEQEIAAKADELVECWTATLLTPRSRFRHGPGHLPTPRPKAAGHRRFRLAIPEEGFPLADPLDLKRRDRAWWIRRLRREARVARNWYYAALGVVGLKGHVHCPKHSLRVWRQRQAAARSFASKRVIVPQGGGEPISLAEVQAAARDGTVARVYCMMKALSARARARGLVPFFLTMTLPGEWHPNPTEVITVNGKMRRIRRALWDRKTPRSWTTAHGPQEADAELQRRWALLRALWQRDGVDPEGFWSREPHEDGCPHQHGVVWVEADKAPAMVARMQEVFPGERGCKVDRINEDIARAETYAMYYVLKSFNANPNDYIDPKARPANDNDGEDALGNHEAVRAWACERGLRRFAFIGEAHGLQRVWQTVAGWKEAPADASETMRAAWQAMKEGEFDAALGILAGDGDERPLRLAYEERTTRYGEPRRAVVGLFDAATGEFVRRVAWTVQTLDSTPPVTLADTLPRAAGAACDAPPTKPQPPPPKRRSTAPKGIDASLRRLIDADAERREREYAATVALLRDGSQKAAEAA